MIQLKVTILENNYLLVFNYNIPLLLLQIFIIKNLIIKNYKKIKI